MKKSLLLVVLCLAMLLPCKKSYAQLEIGISTGYSLNWLTTSSGYHYDRYYSEQGGVAIAVPVRYQFKDWFALQAEIAYVQKNYRWDRSQDVTSVDFYQTYRNSFLQLPIMANFSFGGKSLRGFLNLGGYVGAWVGSHTKGAIPGISSDNDIYYFNECVPFDSKRDNRFDAGLLIGVGLEYRINSLIRVFAEGRYLYGLTDLQKKYMIDLIPRYNNTLTVQVGVSFRLRK